MSEIVERLRKAEECAHVWVSNSGRGGEPRFRSHGPTMPAHTMHVRCAKCGCRTWFTPSQWEGLEVEDEG